MHSGQHDSFRFKNLPTLSLLFSFFILFGQLSLCLGQSDAGAENDLQPVVQWSPAAIPGNKGGLQVLFSQNLRRNYAIHVSLKALAPWVSKAYPNSAVEVTFGRATLQPDAASKTKVYSGHKAYSKP